MGADAAYRAGISAFRAGDPAGAAKLFRKAARLSPQAPEPRLNLGVALKALGCFEDALAAYREAVRLRPGYGAALHNIGLLLRHLGRAEEAVGVLRQALESDPGNPQVMASLGGALDEAGEPEAAVGLLREALDRFPDFPEALNNLGNALERLGRLEEAEIHLRRALNYAPGMARLHLNLAGVLQQQARLAEAVQACEQALRLEPDLIEACVRRAKLLLLQGRLAEGWQAYEARWRLPGYGAGLVLPDSPLWTGEPLAGRRLLVASEQGFGDTIQFVRHAAALEGTVLLHCQPALAGLFRDFDGIAAVVGTGDPAPEHDLFVPLLSLPRLAPDRKRPVPYLTADPRRVKAWQARLGPRNGKHPRIGLCWRGNPRQNNDRNRSMPDAAARGLIERPGFDWISLQVDRPPLPGMQDFSEAIHDFADTAALLANLDLVVTVDTAVAHLAGALGLPVWILLCRVPDWRWGVAGESIADYPTARLFRQTAPADWAGVVAAVGKALQGLPETTPRSFRTA